MPVPVVAVGAARHTGADGVVGLLGPVGNGRGIVVLLEKDNVLTHEEKATYINM